MHTGRDGATGVSCSFFTGSGQSLHFQFQAQGRRLSLILPVYLLHHKVFIICKPVYAGYMSVCVRAHVCISSSYFLISGFRGTQSCQLCILQTFHFSSMHGVEAVNFLWFHQKSASEGPD